MTKFYDHSGRMPEPIKRAIEFQDTSHVCRGDISVTELIDSPFMFWLRKNKAHDVEASYQSRMFALYGSVMSSILEKFGGELAEVRCYREFGDVSVSGSTDLAYDKGTLFDYKFTSVFVAKDAPNNKICEHWEKQVNIYYHLLRLDGYKHIPDITRLSIAMILRDWGPRYKSEQPEPFKIVDVRMWSPAEFDAYMAARLAAHYHVLKKNEEPACCTDEDRWMNDFAVLKVGLKKAMKAGFSSRYEALQYIESLPGDHSIYSVRDAKPKRCMDYCDYGACGLCPYYTPSNESED